MASINRHLIIVVLSALLPLLVVSALLAILLVEKERGGTEHTLQESAQRLSQAVDAELQRSFAALEVLARSEPLRRGDLRVFYAEAGEVRTALGLWDNVLLLSPSAEHLLNLRRPYGEKLPPVPQPQGTLQAASTGFPYVSDALKGRVETEWLMYIAFPVVHDGAVRYVIGVTMSSQYWSKWLAERAPAGVHAGITDRNDIVLARTQDHERYVGMQVPAWYRKALGAAQSGVVRGEGLTSPDVVAAFHRSAISGWSVNLTTSGAILDAPIRQTGLLVSLAVAAALGIAVTLALTRARALADGIRALQDALEGLKAARRPPRMRSPVREIQSAMEAAQVTADVLGSRAESLAHAQEADREAQEALREADRRKDEFLATLSHELRNPLAPLRNALHLLKLSKVDDPAVREAQDIMDRQVRHMVRLIDDLLDVSRITRGRLELRRESVDLGRVVEQAIETARPHVAQGLAVSLPREPVRLYGDPVRLAQVFSNLINNAAKYTPASGRIAITACVEGGHAVVSVSDTGIGIAPEQLPRLFEMFAQAKSALDRSQGGLGIGLSLARSLVELHGGTIEAKSEGAGRGSEFIVRLPLPAASQAGAA
jgi:signal transduction histidine kinase